MSREIRLVPRGWEHPKDENGKFIPLFGYDFDKEVAEWNEGSAKWAEGLRKSTSCEGWEPITDDIKSETYSEWAGNKPLKEDYMPSFEGKELTHMILYETTTEGTPNSPAFRSAEALAHWLTDNKKTVWANETCSYEKWLEIIQEGSTVGNCY